MATLQHILSYLSHRFVVDIILDVCFLDLHDIDSLLILVDIYGSENGLLYMLDEGDFCFLVV